MQRRLQSSDFQAPGAEIKTSARRGCFSLIVPVIIFGATFLGIGVALLSVFAPNLLSQVAGGLSNMSVKTSQPITGDPAHFDPIKSYAEARDFAAKDAQLVELTISYVRPDGTLDLTATYKPAPQVEYKFVEPVPTPTNAPPLGAGSGGAQWYLPITIDAYRPGAAESIQDYSGGSSLQYTFVNKGYSRDTDSVSNDSVTVLPVPDCKLSDLWQTAIQRDNAPVNAVATITYDSAGYRFDIDGTSIHLEFGMDCQRRSG